MSVTFDGFGDPGESRKAIDCQFPSAERFMRNRSKLSHQDTAAAGALAAVVSDPLKKELKVRFEKPGPAAAAVKGSEAASFTL